MKARFIALALASAALAGGSASAQMAVIDAKALIQAKQTVTQLQSQLAQLKQQYAALSGTSNMNSLLNNPQLRTLLPADWRKVYDATANGGYAGISGPASALSAAEKLTGTAAEMQAAIDKRQANIAATNKAMGLQAYDAADQRLDNIEALLGQVGQTSDTKRAIDLQSRIAAEQARVANETTKLQLMAMLQQNEQRLADQQQQQLNANYLNPANSKMGSIRN
jgi:type IV secretion system protein VirB5